jgi:dihydrofolate synthase/folylpolyglutamate synthase
MYKKSMKADQWLRSLERFGVRLGLLRIERIISLLGDPHKDLSLIHIAGTNGKGSVATFISYVLRETGAKTGLYTSPHLISVCERIKVDGVQIRKEELFGLIDRIRGITEGWDEPPTYFEVLTAAAFLFFAKEGVDFAVVETGLGGRLDATNIITPILSIITNVGFDHTEHLGNTIEEIAEEKAGIIKEDVPVVVGDCREGLSVVKDVAKEKGSPLFIFGEDFRVRGRYDSFLFEMGSVLYRDLSISIIGDHFMENAAIACCALQILRDRIRWKDEDLRNGLRRANLSGRMEIVSRKPLILLDGAHNSEGALALSDTLKKHFGGYKPIFVVGICADKEIEGFIRNLNIERAVFTKARISRAADPERLGEIGRRYTDRVNVIPDAKDALCYAKGIVREGDIVVVCGSLYLVGEILERCF